MSHWLLGEALGVKEVKVPSSKEEVQEMAEAVREFVGGGAASKALLTVRCAQRDGSSHRRAAAACNRLQPPACRTDPR